MELNADSFSARPNLSEMTLQFQPVTGSQLCCYCTADTERSSYCQCSNASILQDEGEGENAYGSCHDYMNTEDTTGQCNKAPTGRNIAPGNAGAAATGSLEVATSTPTIASADTGPRCGGRRGGSGLGASSSVPYLSVLWSSTDYLPLVRASNPLAVQTITPSSAGTAPYDSSLVQSMCSMCEERACQPRRELLNEQNTRLHKPQSLHSLRNAESFQSVCSECRHELDSCEVVMNRSAVSLCRLSLHHYDHLAAREEQDSPPGVGHEPPKHYPLPPRLGSEPPQCAPLPPVEKTKVEHQQSNMSSDSGVETTSLMDYATISSLKEYWSHPREAERGEVRVHLPGGYRDTTATQGEEGRLQLGEDDSFPQPQELGSQQEYQHLALKMIGSDNSTQPTLISAHPKFRTFFEKLGIVESDV